MFVCLKKVIGNVFLIGAGTKKTHKEYQRKIGQSNIIIIIKKGEIVLLRCCCGWRMSVQGVPSGVSLNVFDHMVLADESLVADLAHERLLARMETHVTPQIRLVIKLFRAQRTFVGLVSGMFLLMLVE